MTACKHLAWAYGKGVRVCRNCYLRERVEVPAKTIKLEAR